MREREPWLAPRIDGSTGNMRETGVATDLLPKRAGMCAPLVHFPLMDARQAALPKQVVAQGQIPATVVPPSNGFPIRALPAADLETGDARECNPVKAGRTVCSGQGCRIATSLWTN